AYLVAAAAEQLLEVAQHVVGLLAAAADQALHEVLRVVGGHTAAAHRVLEDLLDAVAGEHHEVEGPDHAARDRVAQLGGGFTGKVRARSGLASGRAGLARALLRRLLAPAGAPARRGGAALRGLAARGARARR